MIHGETILDGSESLAINKLPLKCEDCNQRLEFDVMLSGAGHYIGTECECGPYSRETGYFKNREEAEETLRKWEETGKMPHVRK